MIYVSCCAATARRGCTCRSSWQLNTAFGSASCAPRKAVTSTRFIPNTRRRRISSPWIFSVTVHKSAITQR